MGCREAAIAAVEKIDDIDRVVVRQCFDRRFTVERMTADYIQLYEKLLLSRQLNGHIHGRPLVAVQGPIDVQPIRPM